MSVLLPQNGDRDVGAGSGMGVNGSLPGVRDLERRIAEVLVHGSLQLPDGEHPLHESGRSDRMAAGNQTAGRIHGQERVRPAGRARSRFRA